MEGGEKMRITVLLVTILVAVAFVGSAFATPAGKSVEFAGGGQGKVVFDGKTHADKGLKCNDCHTKLFQMKKGTFKMTKEDHGNDKGCGACHNGTKAFGQKDDASCGKCHKK
jgi:c(7)-type cytochrome triheme protein